MTPLLRASRLAKHFPAGRRLLGTAVSLKAVEDVSLEVFPGKTLGLVGESGCGKSTVGRMLLGLLPPTSGEVVFRGTRLQGPESLAPLRRHMQMVFQDPASALNPRRSLRQALEEPFEIHEPGMARSEREDRVHALVRRVGLRPEHLDRLPGDLSGGQRQRVVIARAVALDPSFVFADEPVSALDVSVRAQILNLLNDLQREQGLAYLFVSHDLQVVRHMADDVAVMYLGRILERAPSADFFRRPRHPYSQALLSSMPDRAVGRILVQGEAPSPLHPPPGCPFHTRCPRFAGLSGADRARCTAMPPPLEPAGPPGHQTACWFPGD